MTQSVIPGGVVGPAGPAGAAGPAGPPGAAVGGTSLASSTSVGATSLTLNSSLLATTSQGYLAIAPFTTGCEIRRLGTVSGVSVTGLTALKVAHAEDTPVFHFTEDSVPAAWFGCKGDGSTGDTGTDDADALQWAMIETAREALWLHGQNRLYMVSQPVMLGQSGKIKHLNLRAKSAFSPADTNGAMLMNMQGVIIPFTGSASTDAMTATAHGLPATDVAVMFKGPSLPGNVVSGRIYYVRDITSTTFKITETRGGAVHNITSDGSGTVYTEALSQQKVYIDDVFVNGRALAGLNGVALSLQQPAFIRKLRCDFFNTGTGLTIIGQQAIFENFEAINCGTGCALENMTEAWFYGFDVEQFVDKGLHVRETPEIFAEGGAFSCLFDGIHIEMFDAPSSKVAFDLEGNCHNLEFNNTNISMSNIAGQRAWYIHHPVSAGANSYRIRGVRFQGLTGASGVYAIQDDNRDLLLDCWDDFRMQITDFWAPALPASQLYADPGSMMVPRTESGYTRWGAQNRDQPNQQMRADTNQTGELSLWRDKTGAKASWVNKDGFVTTAKTSAPADGDLVAGQIMFWFDQTNGAAKLMVKAKEAGGTVRTGEVLLT